MLTSHFRIEIEEEFQAVESQSEELCSTLSTLVDKTQRVFRNRLRVEQAASTIALTTGVCPDLVTARQELSQMRALLARMMRQEGLELISAGTHPSMTWQTQRNNDRPRGHEPEHESQDGMHQCSPFGLHIRVGVVDNHELTIQLINQLRTWVPHLLALSSNSPFWAGHLTSFKSYRSMVWQRNAPRSSLPEVIPSLEAFNRYINDLTIMKCITSRKDLWWYVRPDFPSQSIEFCIGDMPATVEDTLALAALCQALIAKLTWLFERRRPMTPILSRHYIEENLWRAMRYGLDTRVTDFALKRTLNMRAAIHELLCFVEDIANDLGTSREIHFLRALLDSPRGTGADHQIAVYQQRGNIQDVIHLLLKETMRGVEDTVPGAFREAETDAHLPAINSIQMTGKEAFREAETETKLQAVESLRPLRNYESELK